MRLQPMLIHRPMRCEEEMIDCKISARRFSRTTPALRETPRPMLALKKQVKPRVKLHRRSSRRILSPTRFGLRSTKLLLPLLSTEWAEWRSSLAVSCARIQNRKSDLEPD